MPMVIIFGLGRKKTPVFFSASVATSLPSHDERLTYHHQYSFSLADGGLSTCSCTCANGRSNWEVQKLIIKNEFRCGSSWLIINLGYCWQFRSAFLRQDWSICLCQGQAPDRCANMTDSVLWWGKRPLNSLWCIALAAANLRQNWAQIISLPTASGNLSPLRRGKPI